MKRTVVACCVLVICCGGVTLSGPALASPIAIDIANDAKSTITFNAANSGTSVGSFSFQSTPVASGGTGHDFNITNVSPQLSPATTSFHGDVSGTYRIQPITILSPSEQFANVTGTGVLSIFDGSKTFDASVNWVSIDTLAGSKSSTATLNLNGDINLNSFSYTGSNPDLLSLLADKNGSASISLTIKPPQSLHQLTDGNTKITVVKNFGGEITATPEPAGISLLATGLVAFVPFALRSVRCRRGN
jgi:hypothetical protein